jgi:hypothetical protein
MSDALVRKCNVCGLRFLKSDGCNLMTCRCGNKQCFVCSVNIKDHSHFSNETCPMYGDTEYILSSDVVKARNKTIERLREERADFKEEDMPKAQVTRSQPASAQIAFFVPPPPRMNPPPQPARPAAPPMAIQARHWPYPPVAQPPYQPQPSFQVPPPANNFNNYPTPWGPPPAQTYQNWNPPPQQPQYQANPYAPQPGYQPYTATYNPPVQPQPPTIGQPPAIGQPPKVNYGYGYAPYSGAQPQAPAWTHPAYPPTPAAASTSSTPTYNSQAPKPYSGYYSAQPPAQPPAWAPPSYPSYPPTPAAASTSASNSQSQKTYPAYYSPYYSAQPQQYTMPWPAASQGVQTTVSYPYGVQTQETSRRR